MNWLIINLNSNRYTQFVKGHIKSIRGDNWSILRDISWIGEKIYLWIVLVVYDTNLPFLYFESMHQYFFDTNNIKEQLQPKFKFVQEFILTIPIIHTLATISISYEAITSLRSSSHLTTFASKFESFLPSFGAKIDKQQSYNEALSSMDFTSYKEMMDQDYHSLIKNNI